MEYTTLGRTGLRVSVAGLGCGGFSRLGLSTGGSPADAVKLVRIAIDSGINFIDTAAQYGTEPMVGEAMRDVPRASVVIATKCLLAEKDVQITADGLTASLDASLRALGSRLILRRGRAEAAIADVAAACGATSVHWNRLYDAGARARALAPTHLFFDRAARPPAACAGSGGAWMMTWGAGGSFRGGWPRLGRGGWGWVCERSRRGASKPPRPPRFCPFFPARTPHAACAPHPAPSVLACGATRTTAGSVRTRVGVWVFHPPLARCASRSLALAFRVSRLCDARKQHWTALRGVRRGVRGRRGTLPPPFFALAMSLRRWR